MNKSTPINQLPTQLNAQPTFVNDQQRQMITQSQQAAGNIPMPQNTQNQPEMLNEDDGVIQDMLNNLNNGGGSAQEVAQNQYIQQQQMLQQQQQQQQQQLMQQEELMRIAAMNNMNINQLMGGYGPPGYSQPSQAMPSYAEQPMQAPVVSGGLAAQFTALFTNELKLAGLVFMVVLAVQFIPFHRYISRYIAIDKIPYHDIVLRAMIASFVVIICKKLI